MKNKKLIAYALLGLGVLMLFNNLFTGNSSWLWLALVSGFTYWEYKQRNLTSLLLTSTSLAGLSLGMLLEHNLGLPGFLFFSLAASLFLYKVISKESKAWQDYLIIALVAFGLLALSSKFSILLILVGIYLLVKNQKTTIKAKVSKQDTENISKKEEFNDKDETNTNNEVIKPVKKKLKNKTLDKNKTQTKTKVDNEIIELSEEKPKDKTLSKNKPKAKNEIIELSGKKTSSASLNKRDNNISQELTNWRKKQAKTEGYKETAIISDSSLAEIIAKLPQNNKELLAIKGIGKVKLERYGKEIFKITKVK